jgi:hypothetical protein
MNFSSEQLTKLATRILLAFVLISIGFAWGKHVGLRQAASPDATIQPGTITGTQVVVYYLHGTIRCVTCNRIEKQARETVESGFAAELADKRMLWREVDFDQDPALAKRYDVSASTVVVVRFDNGRESGFQRLDKVWPLVDKPEEFKSYIATAIRELLAGKAGVAK